MFNKKEEIYQMSDNREYLVLQLEKLAKKRAGLKERLNNARLSPDAVRCIKKENLLLKDQIVAIEQKVAAMDVGAQTDSIESSTPVELLSEAAGEPVNHHVHYDQVVPEFAAAC